MTEITIWVVFAIIAKAITYAASLVAAGSAIFKLVFPRLGVGLHAGLRRLIVWSALIALVATALQIGLRAVRISGMGAAGMFDPMMLQLVWESPLGHSAMWRGAGLLLLLLILWRGMPGRVIAAVGAVLLALSFSFVGHAQGDPSWILSFLLTLHLLAAAYWIGALVPLRRAASGDLPAETAAELLHRFGVLATGVVGLLVVVGATFAWFLVGQFTALLTSTYGNMLLAKLGIVAGLMLLAAANKWRFVPALKSGDRRAAGHLRISIATEIAAVAIILLVTATMTSTATPPARMDKEMATGVSSIQTDPEG